MYNKGTSHGMLVSKEISKHKGKSNHKINNG